MKTLKKLPFVLAFVCTLLTSACSDVAVEPVRTEDDDDVIIIGPQPKGQNAASADTVSIG